MEQSVRQAIERCVRWLLPFAAWRMPDGERVSFCAASDLRIGEGEAFFAVPFARPFAEACFIPCEMGVEDVLAMDAPSRALPQLPFENTDKSLYLSRLAGLIDSLRARGHAKTVISTVKTEEMPCTDLAGHVAGVTERLFDSGKGLFCSCWYHPGLGLWMGATPELLLSARGRRLRTMALAGTTASGLDWDGKNRAEHQFVVDYIADALASHGVTPAISSMYDVAFGQLKHLRTDFEGELPEGADAADIIDALNPTPALCGYPKAQALNDIVAIESHDRQCYGGLVGVARGADIDAYVNIRCGRLGAAQCQYFSGGGITADSVPEAEWDEAQAKRQQLINLFNHTQS